MEPAPEIRALLLRVYRAIEERDADALLDAFSRAPETVVVGSDDREWDHGPNAAALFAMQLDELPPLTVAPGDVLAWSDGSTGWAVDHPHVSFAGEGERPFRVTVVARLERAYWRIVHWHLSFGVPNDEVGLDLTTSLDDLLEELRGDAPDLRSAAGPDGSATILFSDIESSTEMLQRLGDERWMGLLRWHDGVVRRQTEAHGGTTVKSQGDGFMLAFPSPGAGVACGIAIQRSLSSGWQGESVQVRMGVHCGDVIREAGDFFGRSVVLAARVAAAACGGEVLVSDDVQTRLADAVPFGDPREVALKGLRGVHVVYPVGWRHA